MTWRGASPTQIFLETALRLGRTPSRCVVIEDTQAGIAAARAAGMGCIALTGTQAADLLGEADRIVDHLDQVDALLELSPDCPGSPAA